MVIFSKLLNLSEPIPSFVLKNYSKHKAHKALGGGEKELSF